MSDEVLIKVENVSKKFCKSLKQSMLYGIEDITRDTLNLKTTSEILRKDEFWAVDDVSFEVKRGECLGIIGRNGAGKSTLLKMLNGIFMPDKGKITIKGKVGALIEVGAGFHPMLTGRENIYVNGSILGMSKQEIDSKFDEIVAFAELDEFIDMPVKHYSSGMYVRLGFAIAVQSKPDVLILDEVLAVGDVAFRAKCYQRLSDLFKNASVIMVSHDMSQIGQVASKVLLLQSGKSSTYDDVCLGVSEYNVENNVKKISSNDKAVSLGNSAQDASIEINKDLYYGEFLDVIININAVNSSQYIDARITVYANDQTTAFDCHTRAHNSSTQLIHGSNRLRARVGPVFLKSGNYSLSIAILNRENNEHIYWGTHIKTITVNGSPPYGSAIYLPKIQINNEKIGE
ncbi:hypothetical protein AU255_16755 [Methyloprofundus sedimenti]|uniref:ABC transporter domain-containing protein n=1 Tax=Methyloprofundus sedimenti TaxID=1420851 RepID=A0A1V8M2Q5_9GAMM|nr:ABC transporter ATP-binding protein [Methyloprofundus sedimenti]OQK15840.1 hypothetical protein AU255_16755 [Methyloprofundus sedimenti]